MKGGRLDGRSVDRTLFCLPLTIQHPQKRGGAVTKTKAQEIYERVEALVKEGTSKKDAFRQLAAEFDQPINSMRGAYYAARQQNGEAVPRGARSRKKRETTAEDAIERAVIELETSIEDIQEEVEASRVRAEEATAEHKMLKGNAGLRIELIKDKIAALQASDAGE